jgi:hypothetical protein
MEIDAGPDDCAGMKCAAPTNVTAATTIECQANEKRLRGRKRGRVDDPDPSVEKRLQLIFPFRKRRISNVLSQVD